MLIHHWLRTLTTRHSGRSRRFLTVRGDVNCVRRGEALETRTMLTAPNPLALSGLDGATGFRIDGVQTSDSSGRAVSNAGDVNGDGYEDVIIGAPVAGGGAGRTYVVFGSPNAFNSTLNLADLNGTNGFRINGITAGDNSGTAVSGAGDFNGDGLADLLIGAPNASPSGQTRAGEAYIVFGRTSFGSSLNLSSLNGTTGVRLSSLSPYNVAGRSVGAIGDINGDGFDDLGVGGPDITGSYSGAGLPGRAFVLFGHATPFNSALDFDSLDGNNGFTLNGSTEDDYTGSAISAAGDVNGDGIADLLVGANGTNSEAGSAYVVFGKTSAFASSIGLDTLNGTNGFRLDGPIDSRTGIAAAGAGDINGDGLDDLLIGSPAVPYSGDAFVVFGKTSFNSVQQLASLSSANGFRITGSATGGYHGIAVSAAGDVNGDGFDDILTGAYRATVSGETYAGESYVIFGRSASFGSTLSLSSLDGTNGFRLTGTSAYDASGQALGGGADINGDGFDDLLIGAYGANPNSVYDAGVTYLVFGAGFTAGAETRIGTTSADTLNATRGTAADVLIGGRGHDTLTGDGGADVLIGGQGNDQLLIASSAFQRVDGGTGNDSLRLGGQNMSLNLTTIPDNRIHDIEEIDLTQAGVNTLTLNSREVLNASGTSNTLIVRRDSGDTVNVGDFGSPVGSETINADVFDVYQRGQAILKVQNTLAGVRVQVSPASIQEGSGSSLVYTFTRPDTAGSLTINFTVAGTATLTSDYTQAGATTFTSSTGTITLADGVASRNITVAAVNDTLVEGDETLILTITPSANYIIGSPQAATGTIRDNDTAVVSFTSASSSLAENSATPASIGVTVLLSANGVAGAGSLANDITINVINRETGTATPSTDFTFTDPTALTFTDSDLSGGMATKTVSLSAVNDTLVEGLETIDLGLSGVSSNATINTAADDHTVTLTDNDTAEVSFTSTTSTVGEDAGTHAVSVQLLITANGTAGTGSIGNAVSVQVDQLTTGTALALSDFTFSDPTTLTFASGTASGATRSATITLINDTVVEGSESINFTLINALNAGINTSANNHTVTITDNDTASVSFNSATGNIAENVSGGTGRVGVTLTITANGVAGSGSLSADVTVDVSDAGTGTATSGAGNDYQFTSPATLTFASALVSGMATSNATLSINNDTLIEAAETIDLALSNVTGPAVVGATTTHTATIVDNDTAVVSFDAASSSVLENDPTGTFSIPVTLVLSANGVTGSGTLENDITVNVDDLRTGTATAGGTDYTFTDPTTLTFPASTSGAATLSATITLNNDTAIEENETINFVLNTLSVPATVGTNGAHTVTILDDDSPLISVSAAPSNASESGGILTYTFTRSGNTTPAATVVFTLTGTATSGDYTVSGDATLSGSNGTVTFGSGETTKTLRLTAVNDTVVEGDETAIVTLFEGATYNLSSPSTATGTIVDNDSAVVAFTSSSASVDESGGLSSVGVSLIVTANGVANSGTIQNTVSVNVEDLLTGTATTGSDYTFSSPAAISFPAGSSSTSRTVTIPVIADDIVERNETVALALTTVTGGASINSAADDHTLTITNDDVATLTITGVAVDEGASGTGTMSFNVRLDHEVDTSLTVRFASSNGTATAGSDYVSGTGTLTFAGSAGEIQTAAITVNGDTIIENDETLTVTLSNLNASGRSVTIATATATGTILNDEYDFGDAPDGPGFLTPNTYPTRLANNGAFHVVNASLSPRLGATIDPELDGQPDAAAAGDGSDEDGVTFTSPILRSADTALPATVDVDVTLATAAATTTYLSAWIDFDNDGSFSGAGEQIATDLQVVAGTNSITFNVPPGAASVAGETFARFRISTLQGLTAGGFGGAGEVEDYLVTIQDSSSIPLDMTFTGPTGGDDLELLVIGGDTVIRRFEDNAELFRRNSALITSLTIVGAVGEDDSLTVNFANGSPLPAGGTSFIGGSGGNDILSFTNTDSLFNTSTINISGRASGTASFVTGANTFDVNFSSVDSATSDFRGSNLTVALPNSSDTVTIRDDGNSSNGRFIISSSTDTLPSLLLSSPSSQFILKGRSGDDTIDVTSLDSAFAGRLTILGGSGSDAISLLAVPVGATLVGGAGNDTLIGGSLNDVIIGGGGADVLEGNRGSDLLDGRDGDDTLRGGNGTDSLTGGRGNDNLFGDAGATVFVETIDSDIFFTTLTNRITTSSSTLGADVISGDGEINAVLTGTSTANRIDASGLNDSVTIDGGGGNDTLRGTGGDDSINGGDGTDRLQLAPTAISRITSTQVTGAGTDSTAGIEVVAIVAGADPINVDATGFTGRLLVTGSPGNDTVIGGAGNDRINGKAGDDVLTGGAGDDSILAGNGNDVVSGNRGNDVLRGQGGDDILDGGPDNDLIDGGAGSNTLRIATDADITITSSGSQATVTGAGNDTLTGSFAQVSIQTGASDNRIDVSGFTGAVSIVAGAGDDTILGTDSADTIDGGTGTDTFITSYIAASVTITDTESGHDAIAGVEVISATVERSTGSRVDASAFSGQVSLSGGPGSDTLIGTDNADTLLGGNGNDFLSGGNGPDRLFGGNGSDVLDGGIGKDSLLGQSGDDTLTGGIGNDTLDGGANTDRLVENVSGESTLTASLLTGNGTDVLESLFEAVVLQGGSGHDRLDASSYTRRVTLNGGAGDDTLLGGRGSDVLNGEDGIDLIRQEVNANQILRDTLVTGDGGDILSGIERAILIGGTGNNRIEATAFTGQVTLLGRDGDDTLFGSQGNDVISGGAGNDDLRGDVGDDTIDGGDGNDFVRGAVGNDVLLGGDGNDTLDGTDGMDTLLGESDRDRIDGGVDVDAVTGGGNGIAPTNDFIVGSASEIDDALTFDFDSLIANI